MEAVERAKLNTKVHLDFSSASIDSIEEMLGRVHEDHLKNPLTEKELSLQSIRWGAYIGEMIKRVGTGKWQRDSEKAGRGTMPVVFDSENDAFPCSWAFKRIADDPEDNIIFKFQFCSDPNLRKHGERRERDLRDRLTRSNRNALENSEGVLAISSL